MQTIKYLASKYLFSKVVWHQPETQNIEDAFESGMLAAQRWIPVEEEKPKEQGHYLVIAPKSFPKNCKVVVAEFYEDNQMFYSESSDCPIPDVTHWRPIEYPLL